MGYECKAPNTDILVCSYVMTGRFNNLWSLKREREREREREIERERERERERES